ncbi:MAG: hypothetical protein JSU98_00370 [Gemmatimonadales bacterium]|jgi:hypothetical protein|nr:MAG: hypothetical protein JSU98_00370 [Gemmatimonadales bacterium]
MMDSVDCRVFEDQLERLVDGTLADVARDLLEAHGEACTTCGRQLELKRHLAGPSLAELEARVPLHVVDGMYGRVRDALGADASASAREAQPQSVRPGRPAGLRGWSSLRVPLLAAASLILLVATGALGLQLREARLREARLELDLEAQRARVAGLRTLAGGSRGASSAPSWLRLLSQQETITVAELVELLDRVPSDRVIVSEARFRLLKSRPSSRMSRMVDGLLDRVPAGEALRATDLLQAIDEASVRRDLTLPTAELVDLLS